MIDRLVIVIVAGAAGALLGAALGLEYFGEGLVPAAIGGVIALVISAFAISRL
jgi:uncharacterized membrane-anchored protein